MVTAEKVARGQQGFARLLKFEAEGKQVSIEMTGSGKVQVSHKYVSRARKVLLKNKIISVLNVVIMFLRTHKRRKLKCFIFIYFHISSENVLFLFFK